MTPKESHQLRIGLRRLRSLFSVTGPVLTSPEMTRLNDEARWLGQEVGRLRDLDVATNDIVRREAEIHRTNPAFRLSRMRYHGRRGNGARAFACFSPKRACRRS